MAHAPQAQPLQLIQGTYSAEEAGEVLHALLQDKIKFHNIKLLRAHEQQSADAQHSRERLAALKQSQQQLEVLLAEAAHKGQRIAIEGMLQLTLVP
jgi:hypothetical protein